ANGMLRYSTAHGIATAVSAAFNRLTPSAGMKTWMNGGTTSSTRGIGLSLRHAAAMRDRRDEAYPPGHRRLSAVYAAGCRQVSTRLSPLSSRALCQLAVARSILSRRS